MSEAQPSFESDIRPLFRDSDITAMASIIDLSSYEDVRDQADGIYERLADGSMPCDGGWPDEQVATFKAWVDAGKPV